MTNVITDPGFEVGIDGWVCSRGASIATPSWERTKVHSGTGAARLTRTSTVDTGVISFGQGTTRYSAAYGSYWSARAWVYVDTAADHDMNAAILCFDENDAPLGAIQGPTVVGQAGSWVQVTVPRTQTPTGTLQVALQINGRGGTWAPGTSWILDDVYLAQGATLIVGSLAASKGYGWRRYNVRTDPWVPDGTKYYLTPRSGQPVVEGVINNGAGGGQSDIVTRYLAGTYQATVAVDDAGPAIAFWTVQQLVFTQTTVSGNVLTMRAKWAPQGGDPNLTGADASVNWGDGSPEQPLYQQDPPTEGDVGAYHTYPVRPDTADYTLTLRSGAQTITHRITIPAGTRAALVTEDGVARATVSIQEWPSHRFERFTVTLPIRGRAEPVVLTDTVRLPTSEIVLLTLTANEADRLLTVLKYRGRVQLQSACPQVENGWFIVLGFDRDRLTNKGTEARRLWPVQLQEVEGP